MAVLNLMRQKETIRLDYSPESPEFVLDLGDAKLNALSVPFGQAYRTISRFAQGKGGDPAALAGAYKEVVVAALGEEAYRVILDYVTCGGNDAEDATVYMAPVVTYLFARYSDACTQKRLNLAEKYLASDRAD